MRRLFNLVVLSLFFFTAHAQKSIYMGADGGTSDNYGGILKVPLNGNPLSTANFKRDLVSHVRNGKMIEASNGVLYGLGAYGGVFNQGSIFAYYPMQDSLICLFSFNGTGTGGHPNHSLLQASNGKFYGLTYDGGTNDKGTLFEFDPATNNFQKKYDFSTVSGGRPLCSLVEGDSAKLYGTCSLWGSANGGTVFSYQFDNGNFSVLHNFVTSTGAQPAGGVSYFGDRTLVGTTAIGGGFPAFGTIFKISLDHPGPNYYQVLYTFPDNGVFNVSPNGDLLHNGSSRLYGIATKGATSKDAIFVFDTTSRSLTYLHNLLSFADGANCRGSLSFGPDKRLYGTAYYDGPSTGTSSGTLFSVDTNGTTFTVNHVFQSLSFGSNPEGTMLTTSNGTMYGTTSTGAGGGFGSIFAYNAASGIMTFKTPFGLSRDGYIFDSGLTYGNNGKLYGNTLSGGEHGYGTFFEYDMADSTITALFSQIPGAGYAPSGPVLAHTDGKLYGLGSILGPNSNYVYRFDPTTRQYSIVADMPWTIFGHYPRGRLCAYNGLLYGVNYASNASSNGLAVFTFDPTNNNAAMVAMTNGPFTIPNQPGAASGGLILGKNNKMYGLANAYNGNTAQQALYEFDPLTNGITTKIVINNSSTVSGLNPNGTMVMDTAGLMYGVAVNGGNFTKGVLFKYDPAANSYTAIHHFDSTSGSAPASTLTIDNNIIYGHTNTGGSSDQGVIFKYDLSTNLFTVVQHKNLVVGTKYDLPGWKSTQLLVLAMPRINRNYQAVCDGNAVNFHNQTYTTSGTYDFLYPGTNATSDSIDRLYLTVLPVPTPVISSAGAVLSAAGAYTSWEWYRDGVLITGANQANYSPTQSGQYTVKVSTAAGCMGLSAPFQFVAQSVQHNSNSERFRLYPNPASATVAVEWSHSANVAIAIIDQNGRRVGNYQVSGNKFLLDVLHLRAGQYWVELTINHESSYQLLTVVGNK